MTKDWEEVELPFDDIPEPDDLLSAEDDEYARCLKCGVILDDPNLLAVGFCSSECEREEAS